jgi:hypothetical protein
VGTGDTVTVPVAILELILRYFGLAATPDYSATLAIMRRDPYRPVREALATLWQVLDLTDYNSDLSFVYSMVGHPSGVTVRLSLVGPYAVILSPSGDVVAVDEIAEIVREAGFVLLGKELLEVPVTAWSPEVEGSVYEFLFEFDQGIPWSR